MRQYAPLLKFRRSGDAETGGVLVAAVDVRCGVCEWTA
jgi:hypothetical protein